MRKFGVIVILLVMLFDDLYGAHVPASDNRSLYENPGKGGEHTR